MTLRTTISANRVKSVVQRSKMTTSCNMITIKDKNKNRLSDNKSDFYSMKKDKIPQKRRKSHPNSK